MPFTFSHPGIVLPFTFFKRKFFSTTGLVAGSVAPDFEYFFKLSKGPTHFSHSWPSLFYFNLPLGIVLAFLFHRWVRGPLVWHLPIYFLKRVEPFAAWDWKHRLLRKWYLVLFSIVIGSLSHLAWDRLTHAMADYCYHQQHRLFFFQEWKHHSFIYTGVHTAHSLLGLALLVLAFYRLPVRDGIQPNNSCVRYWGQVCGLAVLFFSASLLFANQLQAGHMAVRLIAFFLVALFIVSMRFHKKNST